MEFTTKPLSLSQRIELNNILEYRVEKAGTVILNMFEYQAKAAVMGLKTLNSVEVTPKNVDQLVNDLDNDEIKEISDQVTEEANFSKKKKSS